MCQNFFKLLSDSIDINQIMYGPNKDTNLATTIQDTQQQIYANANLKDYTTPYTAVYLHLYNVQMYVYGQVYPATANDTSSVSAQIQSQGMASLKYMVEDLLNFGIAVSQVTNNLYDGPLIFDMTVPTDFMYEVPAGLLRAIRKVKATGTSL